jgi:CRP-like cAMP-binding protein
VRQQLSVKINGMLNNVPLFEALTTEDRQKIAEEATIQEYGSGEPIVHQNASGDSLYIILSGACGVLLETKGGRTKKVATIKEGDFFGEMSLLTGEARRATVKAMEYATVARVDKALFSTFLASNPQVCEKLGTVMAQRQQELEKEANRTSDELANPNNIISRIKAFFRI